jgi:hypothetical protein
VLDANSTIAAAVAHPVRESVFGAGTSYGDRATDAVLATIEKLNYCVKTAGFDCCFAPLLPPRCCVSLLTLIESSNQ